MNDKSFDADTQRHSAPVNSNARSQVGESAERTDPLLEWNRLARENAENAIVSSMFEAVAKASEPLESFSHWLLLGAATVGSFMIANSEKVLPLLSQRGFLVCGAFLCVSCGVGLIAKFFAVRCRIGTEVRSVVQSAMEKHLAAFDAEEEERQKYAEKRGINLDTGIRLDRILKEFLSPWPRVVRWMTSRHFTKHAANPQIAHVLQMSNLVQLGIWTFVQGAAFLGFLIAGFWYAAT